MMSMPQSKDPNYQNVLKQKYRAGDVAELVVGNLSRINRTKIC